VLASGIDVLSTVNVQHLESLNDQVTELSGVRVRETIPDEGLGRADEIVLVDLTPEELLDRLRAGKVYPPERIGSSISRRAFDAAVRLATAENATIVPAFLACVPRYLPIESAVPVQCSDGMTLLEAIEQKAEAQGLTVDARVGRGRSYRDALRRLIADEHFDRVIVSATDSPRIGLSGEDLEWLLERVPAEVLILRPAPDDKREISAAASVNGHF
jgi:nucleotide-binding universal stress UspA family protein